MPDFIVDLEHLAYVPFPEKMRVLHAFRVALGIQGPSSPLTAFRRILIQTNAPVLRTTERSLRHFLSTRPRNTNDVSDLLSEVQLLLSLCNMIMNRAGLPSNY